MDSRPFPAAVFVPENTIKKIARYIAEVSEDKRPDTRFLVVKGGRYRASTDQVVLYQHNSRTPTPKADLINLKVCTVTEITGTERIVLGAPLISDELFLDFLRESWDESLELDSVVTLLTCRNLRGGLLDYYVELNRFHVSLSRFSQE